MRPLKDLLETQDPAITPIRRKVDAAEVPCELLPPSTDSETVLHGLQAIGAEVVQEPTEQPYGVRDCDDRDPAGNLTRIQKRRLSMATRKGTQSPALHVADSHDLIRVRGAREDDLKDVIVEIPKRRLTGFTGVSGSGKSSLVFGTIAAESQRLGVGPGLRARDLLSVRFDYQTPSGPPVTGISPYNGGGRRHPGGSHRRRGLDLGRCAPT